MTLLDSSYDIYIQYGSIYFEKKQQWITNWRRRSEQNGTCETGARTGKSTKVWGKLERDQEKGKLRRQHRQESSGRKWRSRT